MGPRATARGNSKRGPERRCLARVQWGREQLLAEIWNIPRADTGNAGFNGAASNCSRKCHRPNRRLGLMRASMGPRATARGNAGDPVLPVADVWLQWGREQLLAEINRGDQKRW